MQELVSTCESWAIEVAIKLSVQNSSGIKLPFTVTMGGSTIPDSSTVTYLGVSLRSFCLTDEKLRKRIGSANRKLHILIHLTRPWLTTVRQRRMIVKILYCGYKRRRSYGERPTEMGCLVPLWNDLPVRKAGKAPSRGTRNGNMAQKSAEIRGRRSMGSYKPVQETCPRVCVQRVRIQTGATNG